MPEEVSNNTAGQKPAVTQRKSSLLYGWLAVIFGILLPPAGVVFAVMAIYKSAKYSRRLLLILGVLGLLLSAASSGAYYYFYNHNRADYSSKTYTYGTFEPWTMYNSQAGGGLKFERPTELKPFGSQTGTDASLTQRVAVPTYHSQVTITSLDAQISSPPNGVSSKVVAERQALFSADGQKTDAYLSFKNTAVNYVRSVSLPGSTVKFSAPQPFTAANVKSNAWSWDYTSNYTYKDGTQANYKGKLIYILGAKSQYYFSIYSTPANWDANSTTWNKIYDTIQINYSKS